MTVRIINADVLEGLRQLPDGSVHCVVTSPPYWGLRDYGTSGWDGGDADCDHVVVNAERTPWANAVPGPKGPSKNTAAGHWKPKEIGGECGKCGALKTDQQIGLEATPEAFVASLVEVFREVRRVLRSDGTCWLNLGDSYNAYNGNRGTDSPYAGDRKAMEAFFPTGHWLMAKGLKPKDLVGIPWRVAFALQADGWYLRSDIIWSKPNPMPESVTDRPTKAHEYVFLLTKSERYYYDSEAIKEAAAYPDGANSPQSIKSPYGQGFTRNAAARGLTPRHINHINHTTLDVATRGQGRNKRTVWTVATAPYKEAHFATFPPDLIEPMILAGTSEKGCCAQCGAPWERETDAEFVPQQDVSLEKGVRGAGNQKPLDASNGKQGYPRGTTLRHTLGWLATCECDAEVRPCAVLDPFSGSGTTAMVADRHGRDAVGIELNPKYVRMSERRVARDRLLRSRQTSRTMENVKAADLEPTPLEAIMGTA